jgi:sugar transferase (PEP-CTERM system associated)
MSLALLEGAALFAAVCGSIFLWGHPLLLDWLDMAAVLGQAASLSFCCIVAFYYNDLYDSRAVRSLSEFASRLLQSLGVALILLAGFYALFPEMRVADGPFLSSLLVIVALLLPLRAIGYGVMRHRAFADRVLILGTGALARKLIEEIEARPHFRYEIVGVADDGCGPDDPPLRYPLLGPLEHLAKIAKETRADRIIVALSERRGRMPMKQLLEAETRGILVEDGIQTYEHFTGKLAIEALTPSQLVFSRGFRKTRLQLARRRLVSLGAAVVGLVLTTPLMALIALAIKLDSRGPIFFIQERAGRGNRPFRLIKFRTMHEKPAEQADSVWDRDDSARITRAGRWIRRLRVDELPQLWNIVRGDMDLVGPRPEIMDNVRLMTEQIPYYSLRHVVRPGLTGWAQIRGGYSVSLDEVTEKMRYDLFYIKNLSFWLDLRILVDTVKIVLLGSGAR